MPSIPRAPETPAPVPPAGRLSHGLRRLLASAPAPAFTLRELVEHLSGRGHAALMAVMGLLSILPGVSMLVGPILVFIGLRFAFGRRPWLPRWLLERTIRRSTLESLAGRCEALERRTRRVLRPRHVDLVRHIRLHHALGVTVAACGLLLPLPIPFTNLPLAVPVIVIGLALLEDDGLYAVFGLALGVLVLGSIAVAAWLGGAGLGHLWERLVA